MIKVENRNDLTSIEINGDDLFKTQIKTRDLLTNKAVSIDYYIEDDGYCYQVSENLNDIFSDIQADNGFDFNISINNDDENVWFHYDEGNALFGVNREIKYIDSDLWEHLEYNAGNKELTQYIYDEIAIPLGYSIKDAMGYEINVDLDEMRKDYVNKLQNDYIIAPTDYENVYKEYKQKIKNTEEDLLDEELENILDYSIKSWLWTDEYSDIYYNIYSKVENGITPEEYINNYNKQMEEYKLSKEKNIDNQEVIKENKNEEVKPTKKMKM